VKKEEIQHYSHLVENKKINTRLLILCLANLEPRISKEAYFRSKFKNGGISCNGCYDYQLKLYMDYRKQINNLLLSKYSKNTINEMINQVYETDKITNKLCESVIELIQSNDYCLTDS